MDKFSCVVRKYFSKANISSMAESKGWIKFARNEFQIDNANYMKKLWLKQYFTDVTLVADDGIVRSHKMILAAGSSVFQDLLGGVLRDQTCPCIFLWGVKKKHLDLLLDFLYCGETDMAEEDVSFFLQLSNRLGMVGLQLEPRTKAENSPEINHEAKLEDEEDFREELFFVHETALKPEEKKSLKMRRIVSRKFPCDQCTYRDKDKSGLKRHMQRKHAGREGDFECKRVWCLAEMRKA